MIACRKLRMRFDPDRLRADLGRIAPGEWEPHFNVREYEGSWSGVALRTSGTAGNQLVARPSDRADFADAAVLDRCPFFREVLAGFRCPLRSARLLKLGPASSIREHRDYDLGLDFNEARVHIPVLTNPAVEFYLEDRRVVMGEGEAWYLDLNRRHRVRNRGQTDRVHLVVDCVADDWFRARLDEGETPPGPPEEAGPPPRGFEQFRDFVLRDPSLQEVLRGTTDREKFLELVTRIGQEHDYDFNASDVEDALRAGRRVWIERRVR